MLCGHEFFLHESIRFAFHELLGSHSVPEDYSLHLCHDRYVHGSLGIDDRFFTLAYSLTVPAIGPALIDAHAG